MKKQKTLEQKLGLMYVLEYFNTSNYENGNAWGLFTSLVDDDRANLLLIGMLCRRGRQLLSYILCDMKSVSINIRNKDIYDVVIGANAKSFFRRIPSVERLCIDGNATRGWFDSDIWSIGDNLYGNPFWVNPDPNVLRDVVLGVHEPSGEDMNKFGYYNGVYLDIGKINSICTKIKLLVVDGVGCAASDKFSFDILKDQAILPCDLGFFEYTYKNLFQSELNDEKLCYFTGGIVIVDDEEKSSLCFCTRDEEDIIYDRNMHWSQSNGPWNALGDGSMIRPLKLF